MLEDQTPLIPLALWAVNLSGRPDLLMMTQAGLGNSLTAAGLRRLAPAPTSAPPWPPPTGPATRWPSPGPTSWPVCTGWPASGARAGWTGTPSWSAAGFEAMGCRTDAEAGAARGLAGRPGG